jgi:hypothetical protein
MSGKLTPAKATDLIRSIAKGNPKVIYTDHVKKRLAERELIVSDILHIFKFGYVYKDAELATEPGSFKYLMDSPTPNSNGRVIRAVIIPVSGNTLKIVTVMWVDEDGVSL